MGPYIFYRLGLKWSLLCFFASKLSKTEFASAILKYFVHYFDYSVEPVPLSLRNKLLTNTCYISVSIATNCTSVRAIADIGRLFKVPSQNHLFFPSKCVILTGNSTSLWFGMFNEWVKPSLFNYSNNAFQIWVLILNSRRKSTIALTDVRMVAFDAEICRISGKISLLRLIIVDFAGLSE